MEREHKKVLTKCHVKLLELLSPKDMLVDYLFGEEILASGERDDIFGKPNPKEQARELLDILPRKGSKAFAALLAGLGASETSAHREAAELLETTLAARSPRPDRKASDTSSTPGSAGADGNAFSFPRGSESLHPSSANANSPDWIPGGSSDSKLSVTVDLDDRSEVYKMTTQPRGIAYVINNKNFARSSGMPKRNGTDVDRDALKTLWTHLGFEAKVFTDQSGDDMRYELSKLAREDHSGRDCVIISILTHGVEGRLYGSDGDLVPVDDLIALFNNDSTHKSLIGKPKLFFLQACRGDYFDKGTDMPDGQLEAISKQMLEDDLETTIDGKLRSIPSASDMFVGYATVPGFVSWRNSERGSWFVQSITRVFNEYVKSEHLVDMMVRVNKFVASEFEASGHNKQIPSPIVRLTKKLYFRPGHYRK